MAKPPVNLAKSIKDRLLNISRREGRAFDMLLVRFALERLLYRLSISDQRERFVLKGGMLVTAWIDDDNRVTRDADFLGHGDADPDKLIADFRAIMLIEGDDGLVFDVDALTATAIREEMEYGGVRLKTTAYLERTRIPVTIDIGFGDAMADATQRLDYPTLLDLPAPHIRSYPPATVIAEKFQAMVALGVLNGRMKDYYDFGPCRGIWRSLPKSSTRRSWRRSIDARPRSQPRGRLDCRGKCLRTKRSSANGALIPPRSNLKMLVWTRSWMRCGSLSVHRVKDCSPKAADRAC